MDDTMTVHTNAAVEFTPEMVAEMFWEMHAGQQADFFSALHRISEGRLCQQMAGVVREITQRSGEGDHAAQIGFQTMLAHANDYHESAADWRTWDAQRMVARMAEQAKSRIGGAA